MDQSGQIRIAISRSWGVRQCDEASQVSRSLIEQGWIEGFPWWRCLQAGLAAFLEVFLVFF